MLHTGAETWPDPGERLLAKNRALANPSFDSKFMLVASKRMSKGTALLSALIGGSNSTNFGPHGKDGHTFSVVQVNIH